MLFFLINQHMLHKCNCKLILARSPTNQHLPSLFHSRHECSTGALAFFMHLTHITILSDWNITFKQLSSLFNCCLRMSAWFFREKNVVLNTHEFFQFDLNGYGVSMRWFNYLEYVLLGNLHLIKLTDIHGMLFFFLDFRYCFVNYYDRSLLIGVFVVFHIRSYQRLADFLFRVCIGVGSRSKFPLFRLPISFDSTNLLKKSRLKSLLPWKCS